MNESSNSYVGLKPNYKLIRISHNKSKDFESSNIVEEYVKGPYDYYHYNCDDVNDVGWGCGYRTLQTMCSWINLRKYQSYVEKYVPVPSIEEIQSALVKMGDKPDSFVGSKEWIGSVEISMCIDYFYDIPCKIVHISNGNKFHEYIDVIEEHYINFGSPIMMGGNVDASSKGIFGLKKAKNGNVSLLVVDPHFKGLADSHEHLENMKWISWKSLFYFLESSFYNVCFPLAKFKSQ